MVSDAVVESLQTHSSCIIASCGPGEVGRDAGAGFRRSDTEKADMLTLSETVELGTSRD